MSDQQPDPLREIRSALDRIPIVDTHEHLLPPSRFATRQRDLFTLIAECYASHDLVSAGLPPGWQRMHAGEPEQAWQALRTVLPRTRNTAYWQALRIAFADLYEIPGGEVTDANWEHLSRMVEASSKRGAEWYRVVLKERANIALSIYDREDTASEGRNFEQYAGMTNDLVTTPPDPTFFVRVARVDPFLYGYYPEALAELEARYDVSARSFDAYLRMLDLAFDRMQAAGVVGTKLAVAYFRALSFARPARAEAERAFGKSEEAVDPAAARAFQDFMLHACLERCMERHLPMQVHTGLQAGNGNVLAHSNPLHLSPLFLAYPRMRFDLFHGSYPFLGEVATLAKSFPNVTLNMCWLPLISPAVARRALSEWLETVPVSKLTWGGDCLHVEETYGHTVLMKGVVSEVLADKVVRGWLSEEDALAAARMILRDNAIAIFNLGGLML